jgi:hypothetical protein
MRREMTVEMSTMREQIQREVETLLRELGVHTETRRDDDSPSVSTNS